MEASPRNEGSEPPTITVQEAEELMDLLPVTKKLRSKGMVVKWDVQTASQSMNNVDYYFFWIYNVTAQQQHDISSIAVGNYAVNKHTADVRVWQVSNRVFHGYDGELVTTTELDRLQEELRRKYGIDSTLVQKYRFAHLASKMIPRAQEGAAARLPVSERSTNTAQLSCWKDSDHIISRLGRSPVISSSAGYRAYAEVRATALKPRYEETYSGPLCVNTVKLFEATNAVAGFQTALATSLARSDCVRVEGRDSCEAKGIQLIDWSNDGRFLLVELVFWEYESDALLMRAPVIYDATKREFIRPDVYHVFDEYFKTDAFREKQKPGSTHCEFELHTIGFSPDGDIILSASRPPDDPSYDQVFCLDHSQTFKFEAGSGKISQLPASYQPAHYGTWTSEGTSKP